jgi:hypothetical protein
VASSTIFLLPTPIRRFWFVAQVNDSRFLHFSENFDDETLLAAFD